MCAALKKKMLRIRPVPVQQDALHPDPPHPALMQHEFTCGFVAPKGSGKTTALCNLLLFYKGYFHTIVIFSPTLNNDDKWDYIKKQPLLAQNKALERFLRQTTRKKDDTAVVQPAPMERRDIDEEESRFDPKIPESHFLTDYEESVLSGLLDEQQKVIDYLSRHGKTKHLANRMLFIFDDLVGSSLFGRSRDNVFKRLNTNHRHYSCSILMVTQAYKEIPRTVRINFSALILFEIPNEKEVETVYEENPLMLKKPQWLELYEYAVSEPYSFLYINYQKPPPLRCMKTFEHVLTIKVQEHKVEEQPQ